MGMRFRRSIKIAPGVKFNINKNSVGLSVGTRGAHYTVNSKGRKTASVGVPGTGLYYTQSSSSRKSSSSPVTREYSSSLVNFPASDILRRQAHNAKINRVTFSVFLLLLSAMLLLAANPISILLAVLCVVLLVFLLRKFKARIPQLESQADALDRVASDFQKIRDAEANLKSNADPVIFFLNYDRVLEASVSAFRKSPELFDAYTPEQCKEVVYRSLSDILDAMMQFHFETTYRKLYNLKTQNGINSNIARFRSIYDNNMDKLSPEQIGSLEKYTAKLSSVKVPDE